MATINVSPAQVEAARELVSIIQTPNSRIPRHLKEHDDAARLEAGRELAILVRYMLGICLAFVLWGCGGPPYQGGTLVVTFDATDEAQVAAEFWNSNGGDWTVERGTCSREPCVVIALGDCAESEAVQVGQHKACNIPQDDSISIEVQPELFEQLKGNGRLDLCLGHEIGHVMGHDHSRPGTIMSEHGEDAAWVLP